MAQTGAFTAPYGKKALIVTGRSSTRKSGLYDKVKDSLTDAGVDRVLYDQATQNPLTTIAEDGTAFAKKNGCDVVVAIGGGSIIACAKAIAFLAVNDGNINDYILTAKRMTAHCRGCSFPAKCRVAGGNSFEFPSAVFVSEIFSAVLP